MKKAVLIICAGCFLASCSPQYGCYPSKRSKDYAKVVPVEYFKQGQLLEPDYACPDTLIVKDAVGLNKAMGLIEQGVIDATDYEIDSVLHAYCEVK